MSTTFNNICSIIWSYLLVLIALIRSALSLRTVEVAPPTAGIGSMYRKFVTNPFKTEDYAREPNPRLNPSPPVRDDIGLLPITRYRQLPTYVKSPKFIDPARPTEYNTPKPAKNTDFKEKGRPRSGSKLKIIAYPEPFAQLTPEMVNRVHLHPFRRHAYYRVRWEEADKRALRESLPPPKPKGRRRSLQYNAHIGAMKSRIKAAESEGISLEWWPEYHGRGECVAKPRIPDSNIYLGLGVVSSQSSQDLAGLANDEGGLEDELLAVAPVLLTDLEAVTQKTGDTVNDLPVVVPVQAMIDQAPSPPAEETISESLETSSSESQGNPVIAADEDAVALVLAALRSLESNPDISEDNFEEYPDPDDEDEMFDIDLSDGASFSSTISNASSSSSWESSPGCASDISGSSTCSSPSPSPPSTPIVLPETSRASKFISRFNSKLSAIRWKGLISRGDIDEDDDDDFTWVPPTRDWPFNDPEGESTPTVELNDDMV